MTDFSSSVNVCFLYSPRIDAWAEPTAVGESGATTATLTPPSTLQPSDTANLVRTVTVSSWVWLDPGGGGGSHGVYVLDRPVSSLSKDTDTTSDHFQSGSTSPATSNVFALVNVFRATLTSTTWPGW